VRRFPTVAGEILKKMVRFPGQMEVVCNLRSVVDKCIFMSINADLKAVTLIQASVRFSLYQYGLSENITFDLMSTNRT
jgi:hypothetical protein